MTDSAQNGDQRKLEVVNPATNEVFSECACTSEDQLDGMVRSAAQAFLVWRENEEGRRAALRECAKTISRRRNATELATLLTKEQGKPFKEALQEVYGAAHWFATTADIQLETQTHANDQSSIEVRHKPLGVVAAVTPWNYPLLLAAAKVAPALLTGNTVILKPSPFTPLATRKMCEILTSVSSKKQLDPPLPANALQVAFGGGDVGRWLIGHNSIQKISFTGSTKTGQSIALEAARNLKRVTLELGGNDAAIVLSDAEVDRIADGLFWGAFTNAGQFCVGIKRLYVHERLFSPVVAKLVEIAESVKQGDGSESGMQMGPVANEPQFSRVVGLVEQAREHGGRVCTGGQPLDRPGFFYPPTIVTDVAEGEPLVDEEQFGPALPVLPFSDEAEALERANATTFGLGGSVWTSDTERGKALASRLECGTSWVNQHGVLDPLVPFGGYKLSGIGYENGVAGLREFVRLHAVNSAAV